MLVLSGLLSLFLLELGAAVFLLLDYKKYKKRLSTYVAPIWEITGTMSVFYIVSFEAFYPSLLTAVGTLYILPVLLAMIFIIIRDAFLAYSEYLNDSTTELTYSKIYSWSTILAMFFIVSVLASGITGIGVSMSPLAPNYLAMIFNPFNILLFFAIFSLVAFSCSIFFDIRDTKILVGSFIAFLILFFVSLNYYAPFIMTNLLSNIVFIAPSLVFLITAVALYINNNGFTRYTIIPFLFFSVLAFQLFQYPEIFGGSQNINTYITQSINAPYLAIAATVGGLFLIISLSYFVYIQHVHRKKKASKAY